MNAPTTRGAAVAAYCKGCIHDPAAAGTWREQVAACPATDCPLWRFRPVQDARSCPVWIKSRDPASLPDDWATMDQPAAVRRMRQDVADKANALHVQADGGTYATGGATTLPPPPRDTLKSRTAPVTGAGVERLS